MNPKEHIMIDIETLGNTSNSIITSVGAVKFDIDTGEIKEVFYTHIDIDSCVQAGLKADMSTIMWWMGQPENSRKELLEGQLNAPSLKEALESLSNFITKDHVTWSRSPRFDHGLLQNAYNALNMETPWNFRKEQDVRTIEALFPGIIEEVKKAEVLHHAVQDCYAQIRLVVLANKKLRFLQTLAEETEETHG